MKKRSRQNQMYFLFGKRYQTYINDLIFALTANLECKKPKNAFWA
jgi:hypothetical protein